MHNCTCDSLILAYRVIFELMLNIFYHSEGEDWAWLPAETSNLFAVGEISSNQ